MGRTKILIVDDQPSNLKILMDIITGFHADFEVLQTIDPTAVMDICLEENPEVVITDWEMPEMSGLEVIEKLKAHPQTADIPVIMCTGIMTSSENLRQAIAAGAVDYIRKPIDEIELLARLGSMLKLFHSRKTIKEQLVELEEKNDELEKEKARREEFLVNRLDFKDRDISELAMMLAHKQNLAEQVLDKLKVLRRRTDLTGQALSELVLDLQLQLQNSEKTRTMQQNIDEINAEFFAHLDDRFPGLTKGEKELCGMIKINLSTKEIADLKNIDPQSVRKNRQRLRKKLEIDPSQDLYVFLKAL